VYFVANEAWCSVDEVCSPLEAVLEIDLVTFGNGNAICDDDHGRVVSCRAVVVKTAAPTASWHSLVAPRQRRFQIREAMATAVEAEIA
jgi:hypothetical protein